VEDWSASSRVSECQELKKNPVQESGGPRPQDERQGREKLGTSRIEDFVMLHKQSMERVGGARSNWVWTGALPARLPLHRRGISWGARYRLRNLLR